MSSLLTIAVGGLNNAVTRIANATSNIVNVSSTSLVSPKTDLTTDLINSKIAQTDYAANAAVIKVAQKNEKTLLDITA